MAYSFCQKNPMQESHERDWPNFYFNGQELSKWTGHWHLCTLQESLEDYQDEWDEFIDLKHIWHLQCRLDHVGVIESEDPLIHRICVQQFLLILLRHRDEVATGIREALDSDVNANEVIDGIIEGATQMIQLSHRDQFAIWTNGNEEDNTKLISFISQFKDDPSSVTLPHVQQRIDEMRLRSCMQITELRTLAQSGLLKKCHRTLIHQLPKETEQAASSNH